MPPRESVVGDGQYAGCRWVALVFMRTRVFAGKV